VRQQRLNHETMIRRWRTLLLMALAIISALIVPVAKLIVGDEVDWDDNPMIAAYILSGFLLLSELGIVVVLKTVRTRYAVERKILEHRDVHEYVILWDRPRWIVYLPLLLASLVFAALTALDMPGIFPPRTLGGIWLVLCVLNVLVEQFHMSIRTLFILVLTVATVLLVLHLADYAGKAIRLIEYAGVEVPIKLYMMTACMIALVIFAGWLTGLFHYVAITPNVADLQRGLTETGRQIQNADYDVDFDATDVVERWLFGYGRIILSFRDPSKPPMVFFVPHASVIDDQIRRVRSVIVIDRTEKEVMIGE
jgi:hypothetical protein